MTPSLLLALSGCLTPWNPAWDPRPTGETGIETDADTDSDTDSDTDTDTDTDSDTDTADTLGGLPVVHVNANVVGDTTWDAGHSWVLDSLVYVRDGELTIEPGTTVYGAAGSGLVVSTTATLNASGTLAEPIVFTSAAGTGNRRAGDWGGLVLLGSAPVNKPLPRQIEGIAGVEPLAQYGGADASSNCGRLTFVRIEFAGFELFTDNELNGLTLGGCGYNTYLRNIQVHRGLDDGIEIFGGSVDFKYVVVTGAGDDSLDWDEGWTGRGQFVVVQQYPVDADPLVEKNGDEGLEGDGYVRDENSDGVIDPGEENVTPHSRPTLYNFTVLGSNDPLSSQGLAHLKEGTGGEIANSIFAWQNLRGLDIEHHQTVDMVMASQLQVRNNLWFGMGPSPDGETWADPDTVDDDGDFDEDQWLSLGANENLFGEDPLLEVPDAPDRTSGVVMPAWITDPTPLWVPTGASPAADPAAPRPVPADGFFTGTVYLGAVAPATGPGNAWWSGWTAFPEN